MFVVRKPAFIVGGQDESAVVMQLLEYVAYAASVSGLNHTTIASHLSAVKFFHRLASSVELATRHPLIMNALKGAARANAATGSGPRVRRPVSWGMLKDGASLVARWGVGGRVLYLSLCTSFFFLLRASELFAASQSAMHAEHGLRRGDVAFFRSSEQLPPERWSLADSVEVRFRSSKADQFRKGSVVTRVRTGSPRSVEDGGGAVDALVELFLLFPHLPSHAPLVAFGACGDTWSMWTQYQATEALRQVVSLAGLQPVEYSLHSLRIGGATYLSAGGASPEVLRREGRWAGEHGYRPYVRSHGRDAAWVSDVLAADCRVVRQPGQGTSWGKVVPGKDYKG